MPIFKLAPNRSHKDFPHGVPHNLWFQVRAPNEGTTRQTVRAFVQRKVFDPTFRLDPALFAKRDASGQHSFTCESIGVFPEAKREGPDAVLAVGAGAAILWRE